MAQGYGCGSQYSVCVSVHICEFLKLLASIFYCYLEQRVACLTDLKHIHAQFLDDAFTHCLSAAYSMVYIFTPLPFFLTLKKNVSFFFESTEFLISLLSEMNSAKSVH